MTTFKGTPVNDGSDDSSYQKRLWDWKLEGRRQCFPTVLGIGLAALLLSSLFHTVLFTAFPEIRQYVTTSLSFPLLALALWCIALGLATGHGNFWLSVPENHAWVVINPFGSGTKKMKFGTGFYFIPPWWSVKPRNLVTCEKLTVSLPQGIYLARDGKGGVHVDGSFTYCVLFAEAEDYIGLDPSVIQVRLMDSVKSRIGSEIRKYEARGLAGDTTAVTNSITATFAGGERDQVGLECHIQILSVTISSITLDAETMKTLRTTFEAELARAAAPDLLAPLKEGDTFIKDAALRYDILERLGTPPSRTMSDNKKQVSFTMDEHTAEAVKGLGAGAAVIIAAALAGLSKPQSEQGGDKDKKSKTN